MLPHKHGSLRKIADENNEPNQHADIAVQKEAEHTDTKAPSDSEASADSAGKPAACDHIVSGKGVMAEVAVQQQEHDAVAGAVSIGNLCLDDSSASSQNAFCDTASATYGSQADTRSTQAPLGCANNSNPAPLAPHVGAYLSDIAGGAGVRQPRRSGGAPAARGAVWNTQEYQDLWQLAVATGEEQAAQQALDDATIGTDPVDTLDTPVDTQVASGAVALDVNDHGAHMDGVDSVGTAGMSLGQGGAQNVDNNANSGCTDDASGSGALAVTAHPVTRTTPSTRAEATSDGASGQVSGATRALPMGDAASMDPVQGNDGFSSDDDANLCDLEDGKDPMRRFSIESVAS